jgi:hypothetical protein
VGRKKIFFDRYTVFNFRNELKVCEAKKVDTCDCVGEPM